MGAHEAYSQREREEPVCPPTFPPGAQLILGCQKEMFLRAAFMWSEI